MRVRKNPGKSLERERERKKGESLKRNLFKRVFDLEVARIKKNSLFDAKENRTAHPQLRKLILAVLISLNKVTRALNLRAGRRAEGERKRSAQRAEVFCTFSVCGKITRAEETAATVNTWPPPVFGLEESGNESSRNAWRIFKRATFIGRRQQCVCVCMCMCQVFSIAVINFAIHTCHEIYIYVIVFLNKLLIDYLWGLLFTFLLLHNRYAHEIPSLLNNLFVQLFYSLLFPHCIFFIVLLAYLSSFRPRERIFVS